MKLTGLLFLLFGMASLAYSQDTRVLDSVLNELQKPYRTVLNGQDSIFLENIRIALNARESEENDILDSLMKIAIDVQTPLVLAQELCNLIANLEDVKSIRLLMENISIIKQDEIHPQSSLWENFEAPCLVAIEQSGRYFEAYDIILNSDYLNTFTIYPITIGNNLFLIERLFRRYPYSSAMIQYAINNSTNAHKKELLNRIMEKMNK